MVFHTGGQPGQRSVILRLPDQGLGIAVAVNDAEYGDFIHRVVSYRLIDAILELDPIDWEERITPTKGYLSGAQFHNTKSLSSELETASTNVAGSYHDDGYGELNLESCKPNHLELLRILGLSPQKCSNQNETYIANLNKAWVTHTIFTRLNSSYFSWTAGQIYPAIDGDRQLVGHISGSGLAVITKEGVGMFGDYWGQGEALIPRVAGVENVKQRAEVWFQKVK